MTRGRATATGPGHRPGLRIGLLGPLVVTGDDDRPINVAGRRLQLLLLRLAVDPGLPVSAADLVGTLWPDESTTDPTNALQSLVSRLRRSLGDPRLVVQDGSGYRLLIDAEAIDAVRFAGWVAAGRRELDRGDPGAASVALTEAGTLWRGDPLPEAADADFAGPHRARLQELRLSAVLHRAEALMELGRAAETIAELEAMVGANPLNEPAVAVLLRALAAAGRTSEALARYEATRRFLDDELGSDPGPELKSLHVRLLRGELTPPAAAEPAPPVGPGLRSARRGNLRVALTSFVGREDDLARVVAAVEQHRLTTLIGAGGAGKTRLAIEAARRWLTEHDRAAWLVELAPVTDADALPGVLLATLGGREARVGERADRLAQDSRDRLLDRLRDSCCLLVIDNCEHLIEAAARLVDDILAVAPDVRVLTTSRELLGLTGEALCPLAPLPLPPEGVALSEAPTYPAVRLWLDRAAAARPDFALTGTSLPAVVEIVRRLDGLPLAIELAAARLRFLTPGEIAERLSSRFRLLTGGSRTSLPRHRTLRAVVEWSWDLLGPGERLLAERLAVFPAGCDAVAAAEICADDRIAPAAVEPLLGALVDKSLLQVDPGAPGGARYRMLETIREYGVERLDERGELAAARLAHAEHYAALVVASEPLLRGRDQLVALAHLDLDRDNIAAALRYLAESGRGEQALQMMLALTWYWAMLDRNAELAAWAAVVLEANHGAELPELAYARAALVLAAIAEGSDGDAGSWDEVRSRLTEISRALTAAPEPSFAGLEVLRCMLAALTADPDAPVDVLERAARYEDPWLHAAIHAVAAGLFENSGDLEPMRAAIDIAYPEFVALGDRWGLSTILVAMGQLATMDGRLDDAAEAYRQAREQTRQLNATDEDVYLHVRLADLESRRGDFAAALAALDEVTDLRPAAVDSDRALFATASTVLIAWHAGDRDRALRLSDEIRAEVSERQLSTAMLGHLRGVILGVTALVAVLAGNVEQATADLRIAYPAAVETQDQPIVAATGTAVAGWLAIRGRPDDAARVLGAAAAVRGSDDPTDRSIVTIGDMLRTGLGWRFAELYAEGRNLDRVEARERLDPERYL